MLAGIFGVRYAISELKVERFQQQISEKVAFNHSKIFHRLRSNRKLNTIILNCSNVFKLTNRSNEMETHAM